MADRHDYYFRQRVTEAELDEGFSYLENADRSIVADILGGGFLIQGLDTGVIKENAGVGMDVRAERLLGYDQLGRRLSNLRHAYLGGGDLGPAEHVIDVSVDEGAASTAVVGGGNEKTISIFVEFRRDNSDVRVDGNAVNIDFQQEESIQYNVVQSAEAGAGLSVPPALRTDQLLLADIVIQFGDTDILNAAISQGRREAFTLSLTHGGSHVEGGSDPIPNATGSTGGLHSAADKTKLDLVDFTDSGVGALFQKMYSLFQPANVTAPAATTLDVSTQLSGKSAGGSTSAEGVLTQTAAPDNRSTIQTVGGDDFLDSLGNKVYGRITVNNETTPTVWTMSFFTTNDAGTENAFNMTPFGGQAIVWFVKESFSLENLPSGGFLTVPSDQVAATVPDATETSKGISELAADGEDAAGVVVQGNDSRLFPLSFYNAHLSSRTGGIGVFASSVERFPDGGSARITQDGFGTFTFLDAGTYDIDVNLSTFQAASGTGIAELRVPHDASAVVPSSNARVQSEVGGSNGDGMGASLRWVVTVTASETMNVRVPDLTVDTRLGPESSISISRIR